MALPDDYKTRILEQEGIGTLALGPQAYVDTGDQRYVSDAYQYFLNQGMGGGQATAAPAAQAPTASNINIPLPGGSGSGGGGITAASAVQPTGGTGGGAQNPLTQMVTDPATGQTQTVKQAMTSNQAYAIPGQMPKTPVSGAWGPQSQFQPQTSDPFLVSGAAGGASLPQIGYGEGKVDPGLAQAAGLTTGYPEAAKQDPSFLEKARDKFVTTGEDISGFFGDLKNKGIDVGKMAGTTLLNYATKGLTGGIPILGTAAQIVGGMLPKQDPRQTALNKLYDVKDGKIQSGLMKGYNPVSGGFPGISDPTYGLQDAYDKRIGTIENTLKDKYNMTDTEIADVKAGSYKGDVDTDLLDRLNQLEDAKKKEASILTPPSVDSGRGSGLRPTVDEFKISPQSIDQPATITPKSDFQTRFTARGPDDTWMGPGQISRTAPDFVRGVDTTTPEKKGIMTQIGDAFFPEGNWQDIKRTAPDQRTYNIEATKDMVENMPGGIVKDVLAPAGAFVLSPFYDTLQASQRAADKYGADTSPYGGIVDDMEVPAGPTMGQFAQAIDDENPLSSMWERTIGAAAPLAERFGIGVDETPTDVMGPFDYMQPSAAPKGVAGSANPRRPGQDVITRDTPVELGPVDPGAGRIWPDRPETTPEYGTTRPAGIDAPMIEPVDWSELDDLEADPMAGIIDPEIEDPSFLDKAKDFIGSGIKDTTKLAEEVGLMGDGGNQTQDKYGINTQSAFGDYDEYNEERVEELDAALEKAKDKYAKEDPTGQKYLDMTTRMRKELEDRKKYNKEADKKKEKDDTSYLDTKIDDTDPADIGTTVDPWGGMDDEFGDISGPTPEQRAKEQADAQRAMQEQIAAAEKQEAAKKAEEAAARAREEAARKAQERMNQKDDSGTGDKGGMDQGGFDPGGGFVDQGGGGEFGATTGTGTELRSDPNYGQFARRQQATSSGGGGGNSGGCFLKGTQITMADGSTKAIEQVDLGDNVAKGGKVFATGKFLVENLHDYKGIKVSGSHMVSEDGNWVRVEDSKHGKALGDDEHTVYVFGSENRRILINDILFTDYFEVNEQEKLSEGDKFFDNWKIHAKVDSDNNVNVLNAS